MNKQFEKQIEELGETYESAKDQLIRLTITDGEHHLQTSVFEHLKVIRNAAATAISKLDETYEALELAQNLLIGFDQQKSSAFKMIAELLKEVEE